MPCRKTTACWNTGAETIKPTESDSCSTHYFFLLAALGFGLAVVAPFTLFWNESRLHGGLKGLLPPPGLELEWLSLLSLASFSWLCLFLFAGLGLFGDSKPSSLSPPILSTSSSLSLHFTFSTPTGTPLTISFIHLAQPMVYKASSSYIVSWLLEMHCCKPKSSPLYPGPMLIFRTSPLHS